MDKKQLLKTRDSYIDFVTKWPDSLRCGGKTFKELFTLNGDISLWWLTEMQKKDPEGRYVFEDLCRLDEGKTPRSVSRGLKGTTLGYLLSRVSFLAYMVFKTLIFRIFLKKKDAGLDTGGSLLFVSMYPDTLKYRDGRLRDRYYLGLPEEIEKNLGIKALYMSFYHGSIAGLLKDLKNLKSGKVLFYEQYLSLSDIIKAFDVRTVARFIALARTRTFKNSFNFKGHDISGFFKDELTGSMVGRGVFEWALVAKAVEKITKTLEPLGIVTFLEMYPYSRALYYGAKKSGSDTKTIAFQHANITPMKLWYSYLPCEISLEGDYINGMPVPDYFIFQGAMGRDILIKGGYPASRCVLTGSPRFDALARLSRKGIDLEVSRGHKVILVCTTYSAEDSEEMLRIAYEAVKGRDDCSIIFKAHPQYPIARSVEKYNFKDYVVSNDDVYQLILKSDVLITSYSTTADEAIALGCPSICIDTGVLINMSTFMEIEAAPVVTGPETLAKALDMVLYDTAKFSAFKEKWPELIEATFYKMDGKASERVIDALKLILLKGR